MGIKKTTLIILLNFALCGCLIPPSKTRYQDEIGQATVFHWQNDYVTFKKFVADHKKCLGINRLTIPSQMEKFISPLTPSVMPDWDGIWATFENRQYVDAGGRISVSTPPRHGTVRPSQYKKCMLQKGYQLVW
ncbi:MAG: hypothetical protein N4A44_00430 [Alphaproteobacteria bacterium]|jgi:hypothetical protein|nr:hypothetical protein [Alphaproteobacteria bacterium]